MTNYHDQMTKDTPHVEAIKFCYREIRAQVEVLTNGDAPDWTNHQIGRMNALLEVQEILTGRSAHDILLSVLNRINEDRAKVSV